MTDTIVWVGEVTLTEAVPGGWHRTHEPLRATKYEVRRDYGAESAIS